WPTQARSDCSDSRSACVMPSAVCDGVCRAGGLIGTVWTTFGLVPGVCGVVIWAFAPVADANISVAASIDLMTNPASPLNAMSFKHISLVANNVAVVQVMPLILGRRAYRAPHHEG